MAKSPRKKSSIKGKKAKSPRKKSPIKEKKTRKANPYINFVSALKKFFETHRVPYKRSERSRWCSDMWNSFLDAEKEMCRTNTGADAIVQTKLQDLEGIPKIVLDTPDSIAIGGPPARNGDQNPSEQEEEQTAEELANEELLNKGYSLHDIRDIEREVIVSPPNVHWDEIINVESAKRRLFEATVLPLRCPGYFTGIRTPYKAVLLFGPPGTGKTTTVHAVVTECRKYSRCTFFNLKGSSIASPYQGVAEMKTRLIFELAFARSPSIIMIDELDALCTPRGDVRESESSRRVLSEILMQMDTINASEGSFSVLVIGATNRPFDIDDALRRRFEKRIYMPLPNIAARLKMLERNLQEYERAQDVDLSTVAQNLDGFTGDDIRMFCKEVAMNPMREKTEPMKFSEIVELSVDSLEAPLKKLHFDMALEKVKPSADQREIRDQKSWNDRFGSD